MTRVRSVSSMLVGRRRRQARGRQGRPRRWRCRGLGRACWVVRRRWRPSCVSSLGSDAVRRRSVGRTASIGCSSCLPSRWPSAGHSLTDRSLYSSHTTRSNSALHSRQQGSFKKIVMPTADLLLILNWIGFHFHLCVTGIPTDLRIVHCLCVKRPGDLDLWRFDL